MAEIPHITTNRRQVCAIGHWRPGANFLGSCLMRRIGFLVGVLTVVSASIFMPAASASRYAGSGAVVGEFAYGEPLAGVARACRATSFDVMMDAPAFALSTPEGATVVPVEVQGEGRGTCESEELGGGSVTAVIRAGTLACTVAGTFTRVASATTLIVGGPCSSSSGGSTYSFNWVFELQYAAGHVAGTATIGI